MKIANNIESQTIALYIWIYFDHTMMSVFEIFWKHHFATSFCYMTADLLYNKHQIGLIILYDYFLI